MNDRGFSLLEILIALLILSICLLGIGGLAQVAFKQIHAAYLRSQAIVQVNNMIERIRSGDQNCQVWNNDNQRLLPHGIGQCNKNKIKLCWRVRVTECIESKI